MKTRLIIVILFLCSFALAQGTHTGGGQTSSGAGGVSNPITLTEGACAGAAAGSDLLCADSTLHAFKSSLNNGAFVAIPQLAGDLSGTAASPTVVSTHITGGTNTDLAVFNATGNLVNYGGVTCTNQALTALTAAGAGGCTTLTSAYVDTSIALTNADINTSSQVTGATHLTSNIVTTAALAQINNAGAQLEFSTDNFLTRVGAQSLRLGNVNSATPAAYTFACAESSRGGTDTNVAGGNCTAQAGNGTGNAGGGSWIFQTGAVGASGSTADTMTTALTIDKAQVSTFAGKIVTIVGARSTPFLQPTGKSSGIYTAGNNIAIVDNNGNSTALFFSGLTLGSGQPIAWSNNAQADSGAADTTIQRNGAAASLLIGAAASASPASYTVQVGESSRGGTDTNVAGGNSTLQPGVGTGNSTPSMTIVKAPFQAGASGSVAQTVVTRFVLNDTKQLTSGAATTLLSIPLASLAMTGGNIQFYIDATDGTNQCTLAGEVAYAAENSAGTFVTNTSVLGTSANACTATKTLTATFAVTSANPALLQVTPTLGGITATRFTITYEVHHMGQTDPTL